MQTSQPSTARRAKPNLSIKLQGKQRSDARAQAVHVPLREPRPKRPEMPRGESKMAVDFYVASMLESQVRQLMTEPDGQIHLDRCPTPYRKFLLLSPAPQAREGVAYFEAELDENEEMTLSFIETALDAFDGWVAYLWSLMPAWPSMALRPWKRHEPTLPQFTQPQPRCETPTYVLNDRPDTPGSQATPLPRGNSDDQPSYFSLQ